MHVYHHCAVNKTDLHRSDSVMSGKGQLKACLNERVGTLREHGVLLGNSY
ncbi:hypothetical protein JOB18_000976 [Solea senegalensis]|uniref:Uncharacterized protein n=1 Tax=Solea senegalensis TaxID=28829 RepID=A0AAV6SX10_SOLSE|nr:hypothetical protein JOB18_000976 [Solea senegalensis]